MVEDLPGRGRWVGHNMQLPAAWLAPSTSTLHELRSLSELSLTELAPVQYHELVCPTL